MKRTRESISETHRRLKAEYSDLFEQVAALLYRHDPIGINFEVNPEEYEGEAESILSRLRECHSLKDVRGIVHRVFVSSFDAVTAGRPEHYEEVAAEIWQLWERRKDSQPGATSNIPR